MNCTLARTTIHSYFDGELNADDASAFARHLEGCRECQVSLNEMQVLRARLQESDLHERGSFELRSALQKKLNRLGESRGSPTWFPRRYSIPGFAALAFIAGFLLASYLMSSHAESEAITSELVDAHVRSLQPGHLTDTLPKDDQSGQRWFERTMDFKLRVTDYSQQGFRLVGGRLDVVDGQKTAALVYTRANHLINLFIWRYDETDSAESLGSRNGYNWVMWQAGQIRFCLISDDAVSDLNEFKKLIRQ